MNLNLKKPLAFFDLETTGLNVAHDRIIEICVLKINPDQTEETFVSRINPTIPISKEASEITGIKDEDLKDCPTFKDIAPKLSAFFKNCDLGGFNSNKFDVPLLVEEFLRVGIDFDRAEKPQRGISVLLRQKLGRRTFCLGRHLGYLRGFESAVGQISRFGKQFGFLVKIFGSDPKR